MIKVGCILNMAALIAGFLGGSVLEVDIAGAVNKKGRLQVLDFR